MSEERLSRVEREVSALQARQDATEQRLDRLQAAVADAKTSAHKDAEQIRQAVESLANDVKQYMSRSDRASGAKDALKWVAGILVAAAAAVAAWLRLG